MNWNNILLDKIEIQNGFDLKQFRQTAKTSL